MKSRDSLEERRNARINGRIGAHIMHSRHNGREITKAAREVFLTSFEREVDPDGTLDPKERARRAEHARKAHFARLALLSAQKRSERKRGDAK